MGLPTANHFSSTQTAPASTTFFNYNLTTGNITQITHGSSGYYLDSAHNNKLTLSTYKENDTYPGPRPYQVPLQGGQPTRLLEVFGSESVISPDGKNIAFTRGMSRWRRRHYRGPDNRQLWLYNIPTKKFTQLTTWKGNDGLPRWQSNSTLCYISDRKDKTYNIYKRNINKSENSATQLTFNTEKDIWTFDLAQANGTIIYKSWDRLYFLKDGKSTPMNLTATQDRPSQRHHKRRQQISHRIGPQPRRKSHGIYRLWRHLYPQHFRRCTHQTCHHQRRKRTRSNLVTRWPKALFCLRQNRHQICLHSFGKSHKRRSFSKTQKRRISRNRK